ncbi:hypothetical protein VIGAN_09046100, partial [Vigna angularis var. angularis]
RKSQSTSLHLCFEKHQSLKKRVFPGPLCGLSEENLIPCLERECVCIEAEQQRLWVVFLHAKRNRPDLQDAEALGDVLQRHW